MEAAFDGGPCPGRPGLRAQVSARGFTPDTDLFLDPPQRPTCPTETPKTRRDQMDWVNCSARCSSSGDAARNAAKHSKMLRMPASAAADQAMPPIIPATARPYPARGAAPLCILAIAIAPAPIPIIGVRGKRGKTPTDASTARSPNRRRHSSTRNRTARLNCRTSIKPSRSLMLESPQAGQTPPRRPNSSPQRRQRTSGDISGSHSRDLTSRVTSGQNHVPVVPLSLRHAVGVEDGP